MSHSPLQLKRHFFLKTSLTAQQKPDPKAVNRIETKVEVAKGQNQERELLVSLTARLELNGDMVPNCIGEFEVGGVFQVHPGLASEKCDDLVAVNGASVLFGAIREMVANVSARGPWPMLTLTTVTFA